MARRLARPPVQLWWTLPLNLAYGYRWRKTAQAAGQPGKVAGPEGIKATNSEFSF
jgi:hypothetical protein